MAATMNLMRVSGGVAAIGCLVGLLCAQPSNVVHHPFLWDREFSQHPNLYTPEMAVVDSRGVLWVLCLARMGSEGYRKQHVSQAIFRIDEQGKQLSTAEVDLPLSPAERLETSGYRIAPLPSGEMGLVFNKIHFEGRAASALGA